MTTATRCSKCDVAVGLDSVYYNKKLYCPKCMDQVSDEYIEKMREHGKIWSMSQERRMRIQLPDRDAE